MPRLNVATPHQRGKYEGGNHHRDLGVKQDGALGMSVGHGAAPQGKHQHGQSSDGRHRAQQNLRSSQLIYEPTLSGGLHPGADQRYELTDEEQPEIAMLQGGKSITP